MRYIYFINKDIVTKEENVIYNVHMIKTFLFDCGNVLIGFSRDHLINKFIGQDENDKKLIYEYVFKNWSIQDKGLPSEEYYEQVKELLPTHLHEGARKIIFNWKDEVWPIEGMEELLIELKQKGYRLILLSDMPETMFTNKREIPALKYFDEKVYSYFIKTIKADGGLFDYAIDHLNLNVEECLFVDDNKANVEQAKARKILTFLFDVDNPQTFIDYVHEIIKNI